MLGLAFRSPRLSSSIASMMRLASGRRLPDAPDRHSGGRRLRAHGALAILAITGIHALLGAYHGSGYFAADMTRAQLANFWFYMVALSLTGMTLATYFTERKRAELKASALIRHNQVMMQNAWKAFIYWMSRAISLDANDSLLPASGDTRRQRHGSSMWVPTGKQRYSPASCAR